MWNRSKMKVLMILFVVVSFANLATASFEFLSAKGKFIHTHQYVEKYGEMQLPDFFFPINKPREVTEIPAATGTHQSDGERQIHGRKSSTSGSNAQPMPLPLSISKLPSLLTAVYLFASVCFILCLRGLSTPATAKRGNILGMVGMAAAVAVTFTEQGFDTHYLAFALTVLPAATLGIYVGQYVSMFQMPQLVALFHSFVGLAAMLVGFSTFHSPNLAQTSEQLAHMIEIYVGEFIAAITFTGSIIAACKLHEVMESSPLRLPGRHTINGSIVMFVAFLGLLFCCSDDFVTQVFSLYFSVCLSLLLGFHLVAAIGGADMPVVVSMLNSYSGFATAASGFMLDNNLLIIAGSLIGSSGAILSYIMCRGMNRDFLNVILGGLDEEPACLIEGLEGRIHETTADLVAEELLNSKIVLIVPGYGMAVSRCQGDLAEMSEVLRSRGIRVEFGIHPVAGRMPGHMNVLLAEANVPYRIVKEMDEVNPDMPNVDVALIVGANDTVNPGALDPNSKISGMPVIEVWKAKRVVVMKRSMGKGYAAIDNPLFFMENTRMLFGDAKASLSNVNARINQRAYLIGTSLSRENIDTNMQQVSSIEEIFPKPTKTLAVVKDVEGSDMVAIAPKFIPKLRKMGFKVLVEKDAGKEAFFNDKLYQDYGGEIISTRSEILNQADIILKVSTPTENYINEIPQNKVIVSYIWPSQNASVMNNLAKRSLTVIAIDEVPRVTRAQKLDVRSSMSNLQGYRAVVEAFALLRRLSKPQITAAGRTEGATVFVIGLGVAGLQAVATAKALGATVLAHDVRKVTKEEVESLGGKYLELPIAEGTGAGGYARELGESMLEQQRKLYGDVVKKSDVIICTAAIPGKPSPMLISEDMIKQMKPGSVIVDLATEFGQHQFGWGGNCQLSSPETEKSIHQVTIVGRNKAEQQMPTQASELFSMNMCHLLEEFGGGDFKVDLDNEVISSLTVIHNGKIRWQPRELPLPEIPVSVPSTEQTTPVKVPSVLDQILKSDVFFASCLFVAAATIGILGSVMDTLELQHLFLFVLALIVGYYCVWSVTPALHTPLMSVTNALSGVILIGSMVEYDGALNQAYAACALAATFLSSLNIVGGFYVTKRMLDMFSV